MAVAEAAAETSSAIAYAQRAFGVRRPRSMSEVMGRLLRSYWAGLQRGAYFAVPAMAPLTVRIERSLGTARGRRVEAEREWLAHDWYCRLGAGMWLELAGLEGEAEWLRAIKTSRTGTSAWPALEVLEGAEGPLEEEAERASEAVCGVVEHWYSGGMGRVLRPAWPALLGSELAEAVVSGIAEAVGEAMSASGMAAVHEAAADAEPLYLAHVVSVDAATVVATEGLAVCTPANLAEWLVEHPPGAAAPETVVRELIRAEARLELAGPVAYLQKSSLRLLDRMIAAGTKAVKR